MPGISSRRGDMRPTRAKDNLSVTKAEDWTSELVRQLLPQLIIVGAALFRTQE